MCADSECLPPQTGPTVAFMDMPDEVGKPESAASRSHAAQRHRHCRT